MKRTFKSIYAISALCFMFGFQSCFQDMDDDPALNYPEAGSSLTGEYGEAFYASFDETYDDLIYGDKATIERKPTFAAGKKGKAYAGVKDGYITFGGNTILFKDNFSVSFWYKLDVTYDRAGIISISRVKKGEADDRTGGLRISREGSKERQVIKGNIGTGTGETWLDGGNNAVVPAGEWVFVTLTLSKTKCAFYLNGVAVSTNDSFAGVNWDGANLMSIGSGAPRFTSWDHLGDTSLIDELRIFNKELSEAEVVTLMNAK